MIFAEDVVHYALGISVCVCVCAYVFVSYLIGLCRTFSFRFMYTASQVDVRTPVGPQTHTYDTHTHTDSFRLLKDKLEDCLFHVDDACLLRPILCRFYYRPFSLDVIACMSIVQAKV